MLAMVRYPSQTLRQGGQSPIGKVGHEWKLGGRSFFFEAGAFVLQEVPYRLDPAFFQRAAKPACFVIQFTSGAPECGSVAIKATLIHGGRDLARHF
jgi:hypothetical protein